MRLTVENYFSTVSVSNTGPLKCLYDEYGVTETKDGVKFNSPKVNVVQLNSDVFDF